LASNGRAALDGALYIGNNQLASGRFIKAAPIRLEMLDIAPVPGLPRRLSPSYSPILGKKAMDVAESRNLIHGSDCDTESRIN